MKVLHLNTNVGGGAGVAARRLHDGLRKMGVESVFGCAAEAEAPWAASASPPPPPSRFTASLTARLRHRVKRRRERGPKRTTYATDCRTRYRPENLEGFLPFDIANLHWVANFLDWETCLPWLSEQSPLVWTLHDMNPFRGIWHYQPTSSEETKARRAWDREVHKLKERALSGIGDKALTVISPSRWLAAQASESRLLGRFRVEVIPNGLDLEVFRPVEKALARAALGLDAKRPTIGFLSHGVNDPRKGYHLLFEALREMPSPRPTLVTAGRGDPPPGDFECLHLGRPDADALLRLFYSAVDLFICPSRQDNLPNTVMESMACGTPVVAFDIGGMPDMVREDISGWLVAPFDTGMLAKTIRRGLSDPSHLQELSRQCRRISEREFGLQIQAGRYRALYQSLLGSGKPS